MKGANPQKKVSNRKQASYEATKGTEVNVTKSTFPGVTYSGERGVPFPNIFDWLEVKRRDDNIGNYWRVHDKLYDLHEFIDKHPGGQDWIEFSRGTDITESFESSHVLNQKKVEQILAKYFVKDIRSPRNSPYNFKPDGFYQVLKRKIEPVLERVGTDSSSRAVMIQDCLGIGYILLAMISVAIGSLALQVIAGLILGMCIVCAHNFFHKKDHWRRFYMDLSPLSSYEWRISHAFSHHMYPNTILDFEVQLGEPLVEMLPNRPKNFVQKYVAIFYADALYFVYGLSQIFVRAFSIYKGKQKLRVENLIIFFELGIFILIAPSYWDAFVAWNVIFMFASFWFIFVSNNAAHHHPMCFHDGDEVRLDADFGLCQLEATRGKSDWYHQNLVSVLTTFGEHPLHHLFPTICHSKLEYLRPALHETLEQFHESFPYFTQWELFVGTHQQISRTKSHSRQVYSNSSKK